MTTIETGTELPVTPESEQIALTSTTSGSVTSEIATGTTTTLEVAREYDHDVKPPLRTLA
jgi:hypothetical protein